MAAAYFLKVTYKGKLVEGDSRKVGHEKEIEIEGWSWGSTNSGSFHQGTGGGSGKANFQDFHFSMPMCSVSPLLFELCAMGGHLDTVELTCFKSDGGEGLPYLKVKYEEVLVSSYQLGGAGSSTTSDSISLNFAKMDLRFQPQDDKGGKAGGEKGFGYDIRKMAKTSL